MLLYLLQYGENSVTIRNQICQGLEFCASQIQPRTTHAARIDVSTPDSTVRILIIPTNEELMIAQDS